MVYHSAVIERPMATGGMVFVDHPTDTVLPALFADF